MKSDKELLKELCEVFKIKPNPIMEFWFIESWCISENKANLPDDFDKYWLYKQAVYDGVMWSCYMKKTVRGCFSRKYWSTDPDTW